MNAYRLLFLVVVCITCVILQAKSEENAEAIESDMDFEGPNIREKRHSSAYCKRYPYSSYCRRRCRYYKWTLTGRLICRKLKQVDCRVNRFCQFAQKCCFGKVFKPPTSTIVTMTSTPSPVVSVAPSTPVMPVSPTNMVSQSAAPSPSLAPSPASSSMVMASSV